LLYLGFTFVMNAQIQYIRRRWCHALRVILNIKHSWTVYWATFWCITSVLGWQSACVKVILKTSFLSFFNPLSGVDLG
jgi:hypothetical protein